MSGNTSRRKGDKFELEVKKAFDDAGYDAIKTGMYRPDDVLVALNGHDWKVECKRRKRGFAGLYGFLENADCVVHRDDRREPLITMPLDSFLALTGGQG